MKDSRFYANSLIPNEILDRYPTSVDIALKDIGKQLTERLLCEIQKGEKIVYLKDVTTNDKHSLNMTELKQEIRITDLVRCKDCKWWDKKWGCELLGFVRNNMENFYCADGKRSEVEE